MENLTVKVREALLAAEQESVRRSNQYITPVHLLGALLEQKDGLLPAIFKKGELDINRARERLSWLWTSFLRFRVRLKLRWTPILESS